MSDDAVSQELADNAMREKMAEIERIERDIERRSAELSEGDANEAVELALAIAIEILDNSLADEKRKRTLETMRTLLDRWTYLGSWGLGYDAPP
jgi:hypothetical protein